MSGLGKCRRPVSDDSVALTQNEITGDGYRFSRLVGGELIHELHHELFHDGAQTAGTRIACQGFLCNGFQCLVLKDKAHVVHAEQLHVLLDNGVFRIPENPDECIAIQVVQGHDDGKTANQLGNETEFHDIMWNYVGKHTLLDSFCLGTDLAAKANGRTALTFFNDLGEPVKGTTANKENVFGVNPQEFLVGMLTAALGCLSGKTNNI